VVRGGSTATDCTLRGRVLARSVLGVTVCFPPQHVACDCVCSRVADLIGAHAWTWLFADLFAAGGAMLASQLPPTLSLVLVAAVALHLAGLWGRSKTAGRGRSLAHTR